jgi:glycosyltransferase involved in cell wall biosynthesis
VAREGISIVVTVRNDRVALGELLDALAAQTQVPDEVVVVDGGSSDGTLELLAARSDVALTVVEAPGANISAGRNVGVRRAAQERIACTDAGCRPAPGWLAALAGALDGAELAAGVYRVDARTAFERCLAVALYPSVEEIGATAPLVVLSHRLFGRAFEARLATGRSMAFTRSAWAGVGGFPEDLYAGEDVAFSSAVVDGGSASRLVPEAEVTWRPRPTWRANARMYRTYARGDVRRGNRRRHAARAAAWVLGPAMAAFGPRAARVGVACGLAGYLGLPALRARREGVPVREWWRLPLLVAMKDLSQCAGAAQGLVDEALGRAQPGPAGRGESGERRS